MAAIKLDSTGSFIKYWRNVRNYSQLELALDCDTSSRHLSFIENNRAHPSRKLLLDLCSRLQIPLRVRNTILNEAGYAPMYQETGLSDPEMKEVNTILTKILQQHEPNPAMLIDRSLNIINANSAFYVLCDNFVKDSSFFEGRQKNLIELLLFPQGMAENIDNLPYVYHTMFARLRRTIALEPDNHQLLSLLQELESFRPKSIDWDEAKKPLNDLEQAKLPQLIMPVHLNKDGIKINIFTTVTTLGSPMNITLQELQIECGYPFDQQSEVQLKALLEGE